MAANTNSDESGPRTPPADQDWFGGRRWTGIAAIGFLIVVAVWQSRNVRFGGVRRA